MSEDQDRELQWNDAIEHDGSDFVLLPAGEYPFRVVRFERKRFAGSAKLPPCNRATLTLEVGDAETSTTIMHNLFLHTRTEGLLCQFFRAIGARKHSERVVMDWTKVVGATGRCKVGVRDWTGKDGSTKQSSQIERFLDPGEPSPVPSGHQEPPTEDIPF